jgi:dolichyl-phosphate-mannose--protein O-mannosyl transferase
MKAASVLFRPGSWLSEWPRDKILLGCLVGAKILIHLTLSQDYGYFRDEFYYMQLGRHVADASTAMPLFAPLLMALNLAVLGDSLPALHLWPALAGAGVIVLTVLMVRELGGQLFAQAFAGLCVLVTPVYLAINSTFSYDSFDQLFWAAGLYVLVRLLKRNEPRLWLLFGLAAGL